MPCWRAHSVEQRNSLCFLSNNGKHDRQTTRTTTPKINPSGTGNSAKLKTGTKTVSGPRMPNIIPYLMLSAFSASVICEQISRMSGCWDGDQVLQSKVAGVSWAEGAG